MTEFSFGPYHLWADTSQTRAYYIAHPLPWVACGRIPASLAAGGRKRLYLPVTHRRTT